MQRPADASLTRFGRFDPKRTCLLLIDTQNCVWNPGVAQRHPYFDETLRTDVLPNLRRLLDAFRAAGGEVIYTAMENLTVDGRDCRRDLGLARSGCLRSA